MSARSDHLCVVVGSSSYVTHSLHYAARGAKAVAPDAQFPPTQPIPIPHPPSHSLRIVEAFMHSRCALCSIQRRDPSVRCVVPITGAARVLHQRVSVVALPIRCWVRCGGELTLLRPRRRPSLHVHAPPHTLLLLATTARANVTAVPDRGSGVRLDEGQSTR